MKQKTLFIFKGIVFNRNNQILIDNRKEELDKDRIIVNSLQK